MDSEPGNLAAQNTETYLDRLMQNSSFDKHLTSDGENTDGHRQTKIDKFTKKALKSMENVLHDLPDDRSRLDFLFTRYEDVFQDLSVTQLDLRSDRQELCTLRRVVEERMAADRKNLEARKKLERICKELHSQNKALKEETLSLHKYEEEKRMQVVNKFQRTLAEVSSMVQENVSKNTKLQHDRMDILNQLSLSDKTIQQKEQQVQCLEKQLRLQEDLGNAGVLQAKVEVDDTKTAWSKQREVWQQKEKQLIKISIEDKARISTLQMTVDGYIDKMDALEYSNSINKEKTEKYKEDLCNTQSENITLLKKVKIYKERFANFERKSDEMKSAIRVKEMEVKNLLKRADRMEKVCRKLQLDRALFLKLLQDNHIQATNGETDHNYCDNEITAE